MSYLDDIRFQYFPAKIWEAKPLGEISLRQFLEVHKNPKPSTVEVIEKIKAASKNNDLKLKDSLKQNNLYSFVPSVVLDGNGRGIANIVDFNPIMMVEFDKIDHANALKERLFNNLKSVIASWISPSGRGVKFLIRIPKPSSVEEYKEYYCGLAYHLSMYDGFDGANYNIVLPLFLSYDRDILIREDAEEWVQRGGKINSFKPFSGEIEIPTDISDEMKDLIIEKITHIVSLIDDNAHPRIRSIATLAGGYCAQYGFPVEEIKELLCELISENAYMQKNIRSYCKTARDFVEKGLASPIELC